MGSHARQTVPKSSDTEIAAVAAVPQAEPAEARLPAELSFADAQAELATNPEAQVAAARDGMISSTFDQLVTPVVVPAEAVPEGAIAAVASAAPAQPADPVVAGTGVDLPLGQEQAALLSAQTRNAASRAIETEVANTAAVSSSALGYAAQPDNNAVRVGNSSINVRSGPSQDNKRLFALAAGAKVDVDGRSDGWVSITDARGRDGWVDATLLENLDLEALPVVADAPAVEPEAASTDSKTVAGSGVTVRSGPGKSNGQLFNLASGEKVIVVAEKRGWLQIKDDQGRTGWAYKNYLN